MPNEPNLNDLGNLWQGQETEKEKEKMTITLDEVRRMSTCLERRVHWRNIREYAAAAIVVVIFGAFVRNEHGWGRVPPLLLIAGTLYSMFELSRRGANSVPPDMGMTAYLEFYRHELERQRDALRSVWRWYLLPLVPGLAATLIAKGIERHGASNARLIAVAAVFALALVGVWAINQWAARKLDRKIAQLIEMQK